MKRWVYARPVEVNMPKKVQTEPRRRADGEFTHSAQNDADGQTEVVTRYRRAIAAELLKEILASLGA